jgi:hypothetical protein
MLLATALVQPVAYTTWWSTDGAKVTQLPEQNLCALNVFQRKESVGFLWDKTALAGIVFLNDAWNFAPKETKVALRIGLTWINGSADVDWFPATEEKDALMVPMRHYPVEDLLSHAGSVSVRRQGAGLDIALDKSKMPKLLEAVAACRQHLR